MPLYSRYLKQLTALPNRPAIFWDTCALLDIIRIPERKNYTAFRFYHLLHDAILSDEIMSFTSELVITELNKHYQEVTKQLSTHQRYFNDYSQIALFEKTAAEQQTINSTLSAISFEPILLQLYEDILNKTIVIKGQKQYMKFADERARLNIAPAQRKSEYKDCYIWGTYLIFSKGHVSIDIPLSVFFTVNTDDYIDKQTKRPFIALENDCNANNGKLSTGLSELVNNYRPFLSQHLRTRYGI